MFTTGTGFDLPGCVAMFSFSLCFFSRVWFPVLRTGTSCSSVCQVKSRLIIWVLREARELARLLYCIECSAKIPLPVYFPWPLLVRCNDIWLSVCVRVYLNGSMCASASELAFFVCMCVRACACVFICVCVCGCLSVYAYTCVYPFTLNMPFCGTQLAGTARQPTMSKPGMTRWKTTPILTPRNATPGVRTAAQGPCAPITHR